MLGGVENVLIFYQNETTDQSSPILFQLLKVLQALAAVERVNDFL